jgi:hypothetical protein
VGRRRSQREHAEQETELDRRARGEADHQRSRDRGQTAARAGRERQALEESDGESVPSRERLDLDAEFPAASQERHAQDRDSPCEPRDDHGSQPEQDRVDPVLEHESEDGRGDERQEQEREKPPSGRIGSPDPAQHAHHARPEQREHREDRSALDADREGA